MTIQRDLIQRNISIPQSLFNSPLGALVQGLQQLLAVSSEQGQAWYDTSYQMFFNKPPSQIIVAHAIMTQESDAVVMETFTSIVNQYGIHGVNAWTQPVTTLGYPYIMQTQMIASFVDGPALKSEAHATFSVSG